MIKQFPNDEWATADNLFKFYKYHLTAFMMIFTVILSVGAYFASLAAGLDPIIAAGISLLLLFISTYVFYRAWIWLARRWFATPQRMVPLTFEETLRVMERVLAGMEIPHDNVDYNDYHELGANTEFRDHLKKEPAPPSEWRQARVLDLRGGEEMIIVVQTDEDDARTVLIISPYRDDHVGFLDGVKDAIDQAVTSQPG